VPGYQHLGDDALLALGAERERRLKDIELELETLEPLVDAEGQKLKNVAGKLGINVGGVVAGVMAAPFTLGWSLLSAIAPAITAVWETKELAGDYKRLRPLRQRLKFLRYESAEITDQLQEIFSELASRA
jgi:hypothetical protein